MKERYTNLFEKLKTSGVYSFAPTVKRPTIVVNSEKLNQFCEENKCHVLEQPANSKFKQSYMILDEDRAVEGCIVFFPDAIRLANDRKFARSDFRKNLKKFNDQFYK